MAQLAQSTAYTRTFLMVQTADHITGITGATVTVKIGKAGAAGAAPSGGGTATEVDSTNLPGWYKIALSTTDTGTLGDLTFHCTAASADPTDFSDQVTASAAGSVTVGGYAAGQDPLTLLNNNLTLASAGNSAVTAAIFAQAIESGVSFLQAMRLIAAAEGGIVAGAGTATITIANAGGSTNRVTATVDTNGNRSSVSLSL